MSEHDDLRVRLSRLDPAHTSLDPVESPRAQELLERIMSTPVLTDTPDVAAAPRRRRLVVVAAAAAAVLAIGVTAGLVMKPGHDAKAPTSLTLALPGGPARPGMNSCIRFDVSILKGMTTAFSGTATNLTDSSVTLTVDHWYAGGSADTVTLTRATGAAAVALEGGVAFAQGQHYLITATDGTVNGCGYSGEATPDLQQAFTEAFGG